MAAPPERSRARWRAAQGGSPGAETRVAGEENASRETREEGETGGLRQAGGGFQRDFNAQRGRLLTRPSSMSRLTSPSATWYAATREDRARHSPSWHWYCE